MTALSPILVRTSMWLWTPTSGCGGDNGPHHYGSVMTDCVLYERTGHVATITYNRPEVLNAVNGAMRRDLNGAFARFRDEEEAWVAIVTGAGRAFCAGADLRDGAGVDRRVRRQFLGEADGEFPSRAAGRSTSR